MCCVVRIAGNARINRTLLEQTPLQLSRIAGETARTVARRIGRRIDAVKRVRLLCAGLPTPVPLRAGIAKTNRLSTHAGKNQPDASAYRLIGSAAGR